MFTIHPKVKHNCGVDHRITTKSIPFKPKIGGWELLEQLAFERISIRIFISTQAETFDDHLTETCQHGNCCRNCLDDLLILFLEKLIAKTSTIKSKQDMSNLESFDFTTLLDDATLKLEQYSLMFRFDYWMSNPNCHEIGDKIKKPIQFGDWLQNPIYIKQFENDILDPETQTFTLHGILKETRTFTHISTHDIYKWIFENHKEFIGIKKIKFDPDTFDIYPIMIK